MWTSICVTILLGTLGAQAAKSCKKPYLIAIGHDWGAYDYIDSAGYQKGFSRDMINLVCEAAGERCEAVVDVYSNCIGDTPSNHPVLGNGLQGQYYDGCLGWLPTVERIHFARFSIPYTKAHPSHIHTVAGVQLDLTDLTGKKIGFIAGWAGNEKCIARVLANVPGVPLEADQIKYYVDPEALKNGLLNQEVHGGLVLSGGMNAYTSSGSGELDVNLHNPFQCILGGPSLMARKDSDLPEVWNRGFDKVLSDGSFQALCNQAAVSHGERGSIDCVTNYNWSI